MNSIEKSLPYYKLFFNRDLENVPSAELPAGFRFVFYQPGNEKAWAEIETAAGEFEQLQAGLEKFPLTYSRLLSQLPERLFFIEDEQHRKIATICAYEEKPGLGLVHWVGIHPDYQGRGLSRPLLAKCLQVLQELGYEQCTLHTSTWNAVALKLYLQAGFVPDQERTQPEGWEIVRQLWPAQLEKAEKKLLQAEQGIIK